MSSVATEAPVVYTPPVLELLAACTTGIKADAEAVVTALLVEMQQSTALSVEHKNAMMEAALEHSRAMRRR